MQRFSKSNVGWKAAVYVIVIFLLILFPFLRFLSENPGMKSRFTDFKDISVDQINKSTAHPKRLVAAIENCVNSMDDVETFSAYVLELGRRHAKLNLKPTKSQVNSSTRNRALRKT